MLDAHESTRVSRAMIAFNKQVNTACVGPAFIASVRKKLTLGQRETADFLVAALTRFHL
ncbi:type II toxin-antitoxin system MqsA family antitoxin [Pseudomonas alliivorans]|nr:type II toxin-antitoxin system MqsA family antitoxin [Pseudomonas alliivorans]MEE4678309.1 type II toxin-antitoxin system MqsA family antitoxin [Pseudomonas alliivorans]MEE4688566.1 type II toxin-antitoxin system MqsA family antitoxin [Pseudomonas alliivorans]MEE4700212.1 type II toxin-antitoxin system MqsA family antitoxin [Pseudomonas alliivorans]MEE4710440.1 type II toxin-antitoxin system MqsA family antitoxin [Pseudomonas alliivorans]